MLAKVKVDLLRIFQRAFDYMTKTIELGYPSRQRNFIAFLCESQDPSFGKVGGPRPPSPHGSATGLGLKRDTGHITNLDRRGGVVTAKKAKQIYSSNSIKISFYVQRHLVPISLYSII